MTKTLQPTARGVEIKLVAEHKHGGVKYAPGTVLTVDSGTAGLLIEWKIAERHGSPKVNSEADSDRAETQDDAETVTGQLAASAEPPRERFTARRSTKRSTEQ